MVKRTSCVCAALAAGFMSMSGASPAFAATKTFHMAAECQSIGVNNYLTRQGGILFNYGHSADADVCPLLADLGSNQMTVTIRYSSFAQVPGNLSERPITFECTVITRDPANFNDVGAVYTKSVVLNATNHPARLDSLIIQAPFTPPHVATALECMLPPGTIYTKYFLISYEVDQS